MAGPAFAANFVNFEAAGAPQTWIAVATPLPDLSAIGADNSGTTADLASMNPIVACPIGHKVEELTDQRPKSAAPPNFDNKQDHVFVAGT